MNPFVKQIEYAVRGAIVERASALEKELLKVWTFFELFQLRFQWKQDGEGIIWKTPELEIGTVYGNFQG